MAKKLTPATVVTTTVGTIDLVHDVALAQYLWCLTLDEPLFIATETPDEMCELAPGTKLYWEGGGMTTWVHVEPRDAGGHPLLPTDPAVESGRGPSWMPYTEEISPF